MAVYHPCQVRLPVHRVPMRRQAPCVTNSILIELCEALGREQVVAESLKTMRWPARSGASLAATNTRDTWAAKAGSRALLRGMERGVPYTQVAPTLLP